MNYLLAFSTFFLYSISFSQIAVGKVDPNPHAQLDVSGELKGILIPRIKLVDVMLANPFHETVENPIPESLLVYNTGEYPNVVAGYYYWSGTKWNKVIIEDNLETLPKSPWNKEGSITPAELNTDNIYQTGNVGIGTNTPAAKLDVNGTVRIADLPEITAGQMLVADANGVLGTMDLRVLRNKTYTASSVDPNASQDITLSIDYPIAMYTITTANICGRTAIAVFIVYGNVIGFVGGQARNIPYTYTVADVSGNTLSLKAPNTLGCADGGNATQFDFDITKSTGKLIIINRGNIARSYTINQNEM